MIIGYGVAPLMTEKVAEFTALRQGAVLSGTVSLKVWVSYGGAIQSVVFHYQPVPNDLISWRFIGEDMAAPYTSQWDTRTASNGNGKYLLKALANGTEVMQKFTPVTVNNP